MLKQITFGSGKSYKVAILIKDSAFNEPKIREHYVKQLAPWGVAEEEVIAFNLCYETPDKVSVKRIKEHLEALSKVVKQLSIGHVLVADASYFKVLCGVKKADPYHGLVMPTIWPGVQAFLTLNYTQLFHNPTLLSKLNLGIVALGKELAGDMPVFMQDFRKNAHFPETEESIQETLNQLHQYPLLACDVETMGLHLSEAKLLSIGFAWNKHSGTSFMVNNNPATLYRLRQFFLGYKGQLVFHNCTFDIRTIILNVFMKSLDDVSGLLEGLHVMFRNVHDTKIIAYMMLNTAAGNELGLKQLAYEFTGPYALENMGRISAYKDQDILYYNVGDCMATLYVFEKYWNQLEESQKQSYFQYMIPAQKVITQMELTGMPMNWQTLQKTWPELKGIENDQLKLIAEHRIIKAFNNELRITAALDATSKLKKKVKTAEDFAELEFNPGSNKQLQTLLFDHLGLEPIYFTDTGLPSTDSKTISALLEKLNIQLRQQQEINNEPLSTDSH